MRLLGVVDAQPALLQHPNLEGDLPDLLRRLALEEPQGIQQIEDGIHARPPGLQPAHGNLPQPVPGQGAQLLRCLHLQNCLKVLLCRLDVAQFHIGESEAV